MPRKRETDAVVQVEASHRTRWRYILRNDEFQKAMQELHNALRSDKSSLLDRCEQVADKCGLLRIPLESIVFWPGYPLNREDFATLERYGTQWGVSFSSVAATELRDDRFLFLRLDLWHPADDLLPLIECELRQQIGSRRHRRRRLDKANFYLEVFDRARDGTPFSKIAAELKRSVSTVKSAYLAAAQNIFGPADAPGKKALPLRYFDPIGHAASCSVCRGANTADQMCAEARRFASQDHVAQRELSGYTG